MAFVEALSRLVAGRDERCRRRARDRDVPRVACWCHQVIREALRAALADLGCRPRTTGPPRRRRSGACAGALRSAAAARVGSRRRSPLLAPGSPRERHAAEVESRARQSLGQGHEAIHALVARLLGARGATGTSPTSAVAPAIWRAPGSRFDSVVGVDAVRYDGLPSTVTFLQADLDSQRLPLDDASVDVAAAVEVIEHLENPRAFVRELARITRPGGWVVGDDAEPVERAEPADAAVKGRFSAFQERDYPAHRTALLEIDLRRIAAECGLEDVDCLFAPGPRAADAVALPRADRRSAAAAAVRQSRADRTSVRIAFLTVSAEMGGSERSLVELLRGAASAPSGWTLDVVLPRDGPLAVQVRDAGAVGRRPADARGARSLRRVGAAGDRVPRRRAAARPPPATRASCASATRSWAPM